MLLYYVADLKSFEACCEQQGIVALPATPEMVGAYLAAAGEGYAMQILRRRVAAIARSSCVAGHPLDTTLPAARETLRGIGLTHGGRGCRLAAPTTAELKGLSLACEIGVAGRALRQWLDAGATQSGPVCRKVNKAGRVESASAPRPKGRGCDDGLSQWRLG